ncbi:hypothetical protein K9M16_03915 [Candidatus Babeliales bacterium]|nr:hypothetical protein [Candidatus Babeliales bacterium]
MSKQANSADYNQSCVAWFKLAELISRKEKEKALNLYRLLSHSFENKAYALQIEADILWSLEDNLALEKYQQAAFLYKKEQKIISVIAIYEHLSTLEPSNYEFLSTLIFLYSQADWESKFEEKLIILLDFFNQNLISPEIFIAELKKVFQGDKKKLGSNNFVQEPKKWVLDSLKKILKDKYVLVEQII